VFVRRFEGVLPAADWRRSQGRTLKARLHHAISDIQLFSVKHSPTRIMISLPGEHATAAEGSCCCCCS